MVTKMAPHFPFNMLQNVFGRTSRIQKDPPLKRYGEVEGDGSGDGSMALGDGLGDVWGDGRYATKMQLQFLNYALVSFFHRYKIISFVLNSRLLLIFFYQLSLYCIPHVVLSPNAHRPSSIVGSKSLRYDYLKGDGRWWSKVYGMRGGVFLYPEDKSKHHHSIQNSFVKCYRDLEK